MKDSPTPPDPYQTAAAQTQSNVATAKANQETNMVNQSNPYGSLTYNQTGTNPDGTAQYTATTSLSPQTQQLLDAYQKMQGGQIGAATNLLNSGAGALGGKGLDLSYNGTMASLDALNKSRLDPQWQQNQNQFDAQMAAQGLQPGMPGYDAAFRNFSQSKNDAYNSANLADYNSAANSALQQYMAPAQAYGALASGTNPTMPNSSFVNTPTTNIPATNISGLVEQNYQQQSQNANAYNGQLAGLIGTGLGVAAAPFTGGTSLIGSGLSKMGGLFGNSLMGGGSPSGYGT